MEQPRAKPALRRLTCGRCGAAFDCILGGGGWCAAQPVRLPMPAAGSAEDCVCPTCLVAMAFDDSHRT
jgi:hypothetical protein